MNSKVSIIIPCYNGLPFLKETLTSVFLQTYKNVEVIVIDDGSTDGSLEYLKSITSPQIIVKNNKGKGACAARNYGLEIATGYFIQFLDADDLLSPNKIERQVELLVKHPKGIAVCNTVHFYDVPENGKIVDQPFMLSTEKPQDFLLNLYGADGKNHSMVQTGSWLSTKLIIDKAGLWDESLSKDQDGEYFCRVVMQSSGVYYAPECQCYYRKHISGSNIANQKKRKYLESQLNALNSKAKVLSSFSQTLAYRNAFALQYKILAINAYPQFKDITKIALKKSIALGNSSYRPVLGGKTIETIKNMFGWKAAKSLSFWIHKFY